MRLQTLASMSRGEDPLRGAARPDQQRRRRASSSSPGTPTAPAGSPRSPSSTPAAARPSGSPPSPASTPEPDAARRPDRTRPVPALPAAAPDRRPPLHGRASPSRQAFGVAPVRTISSPPERPGRTAPMDQSPTSSRSPSASPCCACVLAVVGRARLRRRAAPSAPPSSTGCRRPAQTARRPAAGAASAASTAGCARTALGPAARTAAGRHRHWTSRPASSSSAMLGAVAGACGWSARPTLAPFFGPIAGTARPLGGVRLPQLAAARSASRRSSTNSPSSPASWPTPPRPGSRCAPRSAWPRRSWRPRPARSWPRSPTQLAVGHSVEDALGELAERLPVPRTGRPGHHPGALQPGGRHRSSASLRNLTETLEERKETRREVRTQLSQVNVTAYAVPVIGIGSLLLMNRIMPGALDRHDRLHRSARSAVIVALGLYAVGFVAHPPHVADRRLKARGTGHMADSLLALAAGALAVGRRLLRHPHVPRPRPSSPATWRSPWRSARTRTGARRHRRSTALGMRYAPAVLRLMGPGPRRQDAPPDRPGGQPAAA